MSKKRDKSKKAKNQRVRLRGDASEEVALRIEELARGLRSGVIRLDDGEMAIEAPAGSDLAWEIEARQGGRKSRIEIEITWRATKSAQTDEDDDEDDEEDEEALEAEVIGEVEAEADGQPSAKTPDTEGAAPAGGRPPSELENPAW